MGKVIQLFTIIGSTLGILAFFQNIFKEVSKSNKEKLSALFQIIKPTDLDNLHHQIAAREIAVETLDKISKLIYCIQKNDDNIIGFKSIFKSKIRKKLNHFLVLHETFKSYVQVPFWKPHKDSDAYTFDKSSFFEKGHNDKKWESNDYELAYKHYASHMQNLINTVDEMERTLIEIQNLANKDSYEYFIPWKWF